MTTDFRTLQQYARALGLTYQQLLARYHAARGQDAPHSGAIAWARQEVDRLQALRELRTSFVEFRLDRPSWSTYAVRLDPEVRASLSARSELDRATWPRVSPRHYLDAALRTGPGHLPGQLACTREFLAARGDALPPARPSFITYQLSPHAHTALSDLQLALTEADHPRGQVGTVVSALTTRFLHRLPPQLAR